MFKTTQTIVMAALCLNLNVHAQSPNASSPPKNQAVSGKVISASNGEVLPGAVIKVTSTNQTILSNDKGEFIINLANGSYNLAVYYLSYKTKNISIQIPLKEELVIALDTDDQNLKEVEINAGYYTVKDKERTGSISRITAETIAKQPVSNLLQTMQGRMSGVVITQQTGAPGGGFNVRIRGQNSIANGNDPFYIIDGVPFPSGSLSSSLTSGNIVVRANPLNSINPIDIQSIEVLKDADATAIYGSRGANGVVLITTKKGQIGETHAEILATQGIGNVGHKMNFLNLEQYLQMRKEAFTNDGVSPGLRDYDVNGTWDQTRSTDWQKELIGGTARYTDLQARVSGGNVQTQFLINAAYKRETTVFPGNLSYQRGSTQFNLNHLSVSKKFSANFSALYSNEANHLMDTDLTWFITYAPNAPKLYDANGNINWENGTFNNPLSYLLKKYNATSDNLNSNLTLGFELLPDLKLKSSFGYSLLSRDEVQTNPLSSMNPTTAKPESTHTYFANNQIRTWIAEPQISWRKQINGSTLNFLAGATFQRNYRIGETLTAKGFNSESLMENIAAAASITGSESVNTIYSYAAIFGRINYDWKQKYFINLTARRDGSSRFGRNNKFANFSAIGAAWIFTNEEFIHTHLPFLSFGKLRSSYGITGNDQIGDYQYLDLWESTDYAYQGSPGLYPERVYNPDYTWEKNRKAEVAIELSFLNNNLSMSVNYFNTRSSNMLVKYALPPSVGFVSVQDNLSAIVQNTGLEFDLNVNNFKTKAFSWSTSVNLTIPRNKLIDFPGLSGSTYNNSYVIGQPLSILKAMKFNGVDPETGVYKLEDLDRDGKVSSPNDRKLVKYIGDKYYGGIQNTMNYKGWQLDFMVQFVKQTGNNYLMNSLAPGFYNFNQPAFVMSRWQEKGDHTSIQKFTQKTTNEYTFMRVYSQGVSDASFLRLKNVQFSYTFSNNLARKIKLHKARIFMQGQNLWTITNYVGLDPESQDYLSLPPLRVFTAGIQLTI